MLRNIRSKIEREYVFATYWTDPEDLFEEFRKKRKICAEVLVPDTVSPQHITGIYVSCDIALQAVVATGVLWPVTKNAYLFFR